MKTTFKRCGHSLIRAAELLPGTCTVFFVEVKKIRACLVHKLMGLSEREKQLTFLYGVAACLSLATIICIAVPWNYWEDMLDTCLNERCGCILFRTQLYYSFTGGRISLCYFTTLASVPAFLIAVVMAGYHGYRVCILSREVTKTAQRRPRRNGEVAVVLPQGKTAKDPGYICWIGLLLLSFGISILLILSSVYLTDGYYKTCSDYRNDLSKNGQITGQMAAVINMRLPCGAIYDFMDYLEPITRRFQRKEYINYNRPHEEKDIQRGPFINTGLSLQIAIAAAWINCVIWIVIFVNNSVLLYVSKGCCSWR